MHRVSCKQTCEHPGSAYRCSPSPVKPITKNTPRNINVPWGTLLLMMLQTAVQCYIARPYVTKLRVALHCIHNYQHTQGTPRRGFSTVQQSTGLSYLLSCAFCVAGSFVVTNFAAEIRTLICRGWKLAENREPPLSALAQLISYRGEVCASKRLRDAAVRRVPA